MKKPNKKQKLIAIFAGLVAVCAISLGALYISGVLPAQSKGEVLKCYNGSCSCHTNISFKEECKGCKVCTTPNTGGLEPGKLVVY